MLEYHAFNTFGEGQKLPMLKFIPDEIPQSNIKTKEVVEN